MFVIFSQEIPIDLFEFHYEAPLEGRAMFARGNIEQDGLYTGERGQYVKFVDGWSEFRGKASLYEGDLIVAMIDIKNDDYNEFMSLEWISLDIYKVYDD